MMPPKQRILLVDDRPENLLVLGKTLAEAGAELVKAKSGEQALAATLDREFAVAILDVQMPGMDGYELAALLRGDPKTKELPIIFLTANPSAEEQIFKGYQSGAVDYIVKPYDPSILVSKVKIFLELHASQVQLRRHREELEELVRNRTAELSNLNAVLRALRNVSQLIVHEKDPQRLVQRACELLVETRGYASAWIGLHRAGEAGPYHGAAGWSASHAPFLAKIGQGWAPPCEARTVSSEHGVTILDPSATCPDCPLSRQYGHSAGACTALRHEGRVLGVLAVASPVNTLVTAEEGALLYELAGDIAFAIHSIEGEAARRHTEELFRASFEGAAVGQALTSLEGRFIQVNGALAGMLGFAPEELVGKAFNDVTHPEDREVGGAAMKALLAGQGEARFQKRYVAKDGTVIWAEVCVAVVRASDGTPGHFIASVLDITAAKRAQVEAEDLARFPAENPSPVMRVSADGTLLYANPAAELLLEQWKVSTSHGMPDELNRSVVETLRNGRVETIEVQAADHCYRIVTAPIVKRRYVNLYGQDITERREAEAALHAEKSFAESLVSTAQAIVLVLDPQGRVVTFNPYMETLSGFSAEQARGKDWFETFLPERGRAETRALFKAAIGGVPTRGNVGPILTRDGRELLVEWYDKTLEDGNGNVTGLLSIGRDVTRRVRAETALKDSESRFRALFVSSADAIMTLEPPSWRFTSANPATVRMFGVRDEQDFITRAPWDYSPPFQPDERQSPDKAREMIETAMAKGSHFFAWEHCRLDGQRFPATVLLTRVDLKGHAMLQATVRDISDLKRAEEDREKLQASLAQSDRLASMGMLAAGVAHEINNPLSYVLFNLETTCRDLPEIAEAFKRCHVRLEAKLGAGDLGAGDLADVLGEERSLCNTSALQDVVERLEAALSGALRIKNIARSLGTFSRVDRTTLEPVNLQSCVEHAATMCLNELKYRATLVKDFAQARSVLASDGKLAQVFLNLLINAAHAIPEGHVEDNEIRVRVWGEGAFVFAEVSDTGGGIAPENQAKIFDPFFTTKGVGIGTGLGLSICKKIVEDFGGKISLVSEWGKGTTFLIRLPVIPSDWAQSESEPAAPSPVKAPVRGRILVIDDEEGIRAAVVRALRSTHEVLTANSGKEGQALLEKDRRFDLIFCDLMMPAMSGMDLHAWLTSQDAKLAEQIVFITGGAFSPGAAEYLSKVGNLRIEKPFDMHALERMTAELIIAARSKRES
jgi:PAS domain S-box-containing protein